ncbi:MAG: anthranilate synthase component I [Armatimonadetes bacterium]|nr:anthranilate synthase component I [Armatimonadota bacterium]
MAACRPDRTDFVNSAAAGSVVPVCREVLADRLTPVSAFERIADGGPSFLLESVEGGERLARYSFLGSHPELVLRARGGRVRRLTDDAEEEYALPPGVNPLDAVKAELSGRQWVETPGLPRFAGGAVGYLAYDLVRQFERLPSTSADTLQLDDIAFMLTRTVLAFDHVRHRITIICNALVEDDPGAAYDEAAQRIAEIADRLRAPFGPPEPVVGAPFGPASQSVERCDYEEIVRRCKEYIHAGDAFQIVPSVRFSAPVSCRPLELYRALRSINPSPYMYYLDLGDMQIVGSSPEILATVEHGRVTVRPIAGTRPRGEDADRDAALAEELLADPKERAEHIMLVDLGRNDVGRVSEYGTVCVDDLMSIERYSHVMHIVSNVSGRLADGVDAFQAVAACFPAGTLTGAPKVRAMEIIEEMEPLRRGLYGGAVGYFSFKGDADFAIAIRTMLVKDGVAHLQAGAGIVADSDPGREYEECVNKAGAMIAAIAMAHEGLE